MTLERIAEEALKDVEGLAVFENLQPKVGNLLLAMAEDGDRCSYQGVRDSVRNLLRKAVTHEELEDYVVTQVLKATARTGRADDLLTLAGRE